MVPLLAMKLRSLYLRYNDTCTRISITGDGKQTESGKFFAFLKIVIEPLNKFLSKYRLKPVSVAAVALAAVENKPREKGQNPLMPALASKPVKVTKPVEEVRSTQLLP